MTADLPDRLRAEYICADDDMRDDCVQSPSGETYHSLDCQTFAVGADEIERLRAVIQQAVKELDGEHRPEGLAREPWGCELCYPGDSNWPCISKMIADDLREALEVES